MNLTLASCLLPCVALLLISSFSCVFIQQIDTLDIHQSLAIATTSTESHTHQNKIHSRIIRSNQNDQNQNTTTNNFQTGNQLQQYYPSKPTTNNGLFHFGANSSSSSPSSATSPSPLSTSTTPLSSQPISSGNHSSSLPISSTHPTTSITSSTIPTTTTTTTSGITSPYSSTHSNGPNCHNGNNNVACPHTCHGRSFLNKTRGYITDGYANYSINVQCTWLIDSGSTNSTIRLRLSEFNTECNYDYLYIFDGNSIYSPLVAAFSGLLKPINDNISNQYNSNNYNNNNNNNNKKATSISATNLSSDISATSNNNISVGTTNKTNEVAFIDEIVIKSGSAFIYFHSDTAQSMPGFNLTYTINSCPYDCSDHGLCDLATLKCKCDSGYAGEGCQIEICPNKCSADKTLGRCDSSLGKCICSDGYSGSDCSKRTDHGVWTLIRNERDDDIKLDGRAFHQAVEVDGVMWIVGGRTAPLTNLNSKNHWSNIIVRFNLTDKLWDLDRKRAKVGQDNLAELFGHTAISYKEKIYIYGGMLPNSTVSNTLLIFDTISQTFEPNQPTIASDKIGKKIDSEGLDEEDFIAPIGVVGHSATLVGNFMYIFFGYNPLYGYLDVVQKYNLIDNSWTIVETKGSTVEGSIGHSSVYDEMSKMILVYGGHHAYKSNSLYSYDPSSDVWRFMQPGPHPRYYHRSILVNGLMLVMGGNSYNASSSLDANDHCFDSHTLVYDLNCVNRNHIHHDISICDKNCWQTISDPSPGVLQRYGHSLIEYESSFYLFGGFNGLMLDTLHGYKIPDCLDYSSEKDCKRSKLAQKCDWNQSKSFCQPGIILQKSLFNQPKDSSLIQITSASVTTMSPATTTASLFNINNNQDSQCSYKSTVCESRQTCRDCLYTNLGCRWCGNGQCRSGKCRSSLSSKAIVDPALCYNDYANISDGSSSGSNSSSSSSSNNFIHNSSPNAFTYKETIMQTEKDIATEIECRRYVNCYLCQTKSYCSWQSDQLHQVCSFLPPTRPLPTPTTLHSPFGTASLVGPNESSASSASSSAANQSNSLVPQPSSTPSTLPPINMWKHVFDSSSTFPNSTLAMVAMLNALTPSISMTSSPYQTCESPCFKRKSCKECIANKCIWCDTSNECIDSSAYFAYYPIGQCMHYVAHLAKCQGTSCVEFETCDQCLTNPKCGWVDDGTGRGAGRCFEGSSSGPLIGQNINETISTSLALLETDPSKQSKWYFTECPLCQCNGHSTCKSGSNICQKGCTGHTEGNHCEKCVPGYYGNPINGGVCRECKCNGHASTCNKDTGKCHCSTKGIIGHSCNKCDEQNHYLGDPTSPHDGTCYYNLTTDYQYTFNMSKADDFFYSDINFMNVPLKRDVDVDFAIVCSSLALVNITSGTYGLSAYRTGTSGRRYLHTGLECGSFRLKFPSDEHLIGGGSNYTFYVHVYRFQTPFVLQIAFSQHRTLDLWQFFFTFTSCFLFLFVMAGVVWKLKQKYDLYRRRQQHVIEMEQMAGRPFATILLELTGGFGGSKSASSVDLKLAKQPKLNSTQQGGGQSEGADDEDERDGDHVRRGGATSRSTSRVSLDKFHEVDYHKLTQEAPSPISIEPCASGKAGILSLFVQLPGRPNLAIGSALVSLADDSSSTGSNNLGNPYNSGSGSSNKTGP